MFNSNKLSKYSDISFHPSLRSLRRGSYRIPNFDNEIIQKDVINIDGSNVQKKKSNNYMISIIITIIIIIVIIILTIKYKKIKRISSY